MLRRAVNSLLATCRFGRRVLVVLGAGASVEARIPLMKDVYLDLRARLDSIVADPKIQERPSDARLAQELSEWLSALARLPQFERLER